MRASLAAVVVSLVISAVGCATGGGDPGVINTQVITFPDGALVEYNGKSMGRAPARITLPQDDEGKLTERAVVRIIPNTDQPTLFAQQRVFEPGERVDRVPNQIMVDMTLAGTNAVALGLPPAAEVENDSKRKVRPPVPYVNRGKPTQAVGLDRWSPGIY